MLLRLAEGKHAKVHQQGEAVLDALQGIYFDFAPGVLLVEVVHDLGHVDASLGEKFIGFFFEERVQNDQDHRVEVFIEVLDEEALELAANKWLVVEDIPEDIYDNRKLGGVGQQYII